MTKPHEPVRTERSRPIWGPLFADYAGMAVALIALVIVFSTLTRHFFSATTFQTIANQIPSAILVATGMTFVLIIGEIDLSVGSVLGLCSAWLGVSLVQWKWSLWAAILSSLVLGAGAGLLNGLVLVRWRLPSFIVTLAMLEMARGSAHFLTQSQTQYIGSSVEGISALTYLGLSLPFWLSVGVVIVGQLMLSRTIFGRYLIGVGTNQEAVRLSGIDPRPVKVLVFVLTGFLVAWAALIDTSRFQSANPNAGTGFELQAIAAVVIGGTSLMGGRGSVVSSFFGVLIIAVLNSGLAAVGAKDETKRLVTGLVILTAVIVDHYRARVGKAKELD